MIDHQNKYIFIHIPKNAGESIEKALGGYMNRSKLCWIEKGFPLQHLTASQIKARAGEEKFDNYFKFSFVRNPFSKCLSEYFWEKNTWMTLGTTLGFKQWVKTKLKKLIKNSEKRDIPIEKKMHNLPQYKFIYNDEGESMVDWIGRFENVVNDFNVACNKIGIPNRQLPHENKANHKHYTEYYDTESREIVAEQYAKDIEYFGYEFGE